MANPIRLKRSAVADKVPINTDLELGELAINTADGRLFTKMNNGSDHIVEFGRWVQMTQEEYDAISPEPYLLYVIVG